MATFSPHAFLTSQGWAGTGAGLRKDSIKKPVTVAHKTNLKGIGKERDTGYAWWDDVFSMVAGKKKGGDAVGLFFFLGSVLEEALPDLFPSNSLHNSLKHERQALGYILLYRLEA